MELKVNPHELILIGENSFIRLSADNGQSLAARCSHWRVLWSPAGAGHVLFVDSKLVNGVQIYADNMRLARFLQNEIEHLLYKPFGNVSTPVLAATFVRVGTPPGESLEIVHADAEEIRLAWGDFSKPFNFEAPPGFDGRPVDCQTTFFPANVIGFLERPKSRRRALATRPRRQTFDDRLSGMVRDLVQTLIGELHDGAGASRRDHQSGRMVAADVPGGNPIWCSFVKYRTRTKS